MIVKPFSTLQLRNNNTIIIYDQIIYASPYFRQMYLLFEIYWDSHLKSGYYFYLASDTHHPHPQSTYKVLLFIAKISSKSYNMEINQLNTNPINAELLKRFIIDRFECVLTPGAWNYKKLFISKLNTFFFLIKGLVRIEERISPSGVWIKWMHRTVNLQLKWLFFIQKFKYFTKISRIYRCVNVCSINRLM